jgi:hypothetical protein
VTPPATRGRNATLPSRTGDSLMLSVDQPGLDHHVAVHRVERLDRARPAKLPLDLLRPRSGVAGGERRRECRVPLA